MLAPLVVLVVLFTVMAILLFLLPSSFELGLGRGPLVSSLYILPLPLGIATATLLGGYVLHSLPTSASLCIGLAAVATGLLVLTSQAPTSPSPVTLIGLTCIGLGVGIGQPVALQAAVGAFSQEQRGVGSGFVNSIRLASNAVGAAIAGGTVALTMAESSTSSMNHSIVNGASSCRVSGNVGNLTRGAQLCAAYLDGVKIVLLVALALVVVAVITVAFWRMLSNQRRTDEISTNTAS